MIQDAFLDEQDGVIVVSSDLPDHLKIILRQMFPNIFFEPKNTKQECVPNDRREFWKSQGA